MKTMNKFILITIAMSLIAVNANAIQTYNFGIFTDNGSYSDSSSVIYDLNVSKVNSKMVTFDIYNKSSIGSSVQEIYIDDDESMIKNINKVSNKYSKKTQEGVSFKKFKGTSFNADDFDVSKKLSLKAATSKKPQQTGIDMGEHLKIRFKLTKGTTYDDIIAAIEAKELKIGLKINSFPDSSTESALSLYEQPQASLINNLQTNLIYPAVVIPTVLSETPNDSRTPVVPVPAAAVLALIGFGCVTSLRKKIA